MAETEPTWIYAADGRAKIVEMARSDNAPEGWSRDPNVIEDEARRTADAVSGVKPHIVFGSDLDEPLPGAEADPIVELQAALQKIAELETVIEGGRAENERLNAELSSFDEVVERASKEIDDLQAQIASFGDVEKTLRDQLAFVGAEVARERDENRPLTERIARLERELEAMTADRDRFKSRRSQG